MKTPPPAHLPKFKDWIVQRDGKAAGTANIYARFLTRSAVHYGTLINEQTVRTDADVEQIINQVSKVVAQRGRWAKGTFNTYDVSRNLIFALQAYVRFVEKNSRMPTGGQPGAVVRRTMSPSAMPHATPARSPTVEESPATDVPIDELPERLRAEVFRLVRDTKLIRELKALHNDTCQMCGLRMQLTPGRFYSEGHHIKPLGQKHNGPDVKGNVLCVCPNCHVKLDFAAIKINPTKLRTAPGHIVRQEFADYHNRLCR
jgi:hypothetical protein